MKMFRDLNPTEEAEFRTWARENYTPLTEIKGIWHPVVQDECVKINQQKGVEEVQKLLETLPPEMRQALEHSAAILN